MRMHQPINWQGRTLLQRFQLRQRLGRGGMGEVWLAEDLQFRRQVAIKLLPAVLTADKQYLQAFANEVRALSRLEHPLILPILSSGEEAAEDGRVVPFVVMPYIANGSLQARLKKVQGILPIKESLHYLRQAAEALDYIHSQQLLHRDVRPSNMFLHQGGIVLADAGITKILAGTIQHSQTEAGAGRAEYMAPEQARGQEQPASDRYSLAMTAYQLFTGILPFTGDTQYIVLTQQIARQLPPPQEVNPTIPPLVADALVKGLAKQPAERFASGVELIKALEDGWRSFLEPAGDPEATILAPWSKRHPYNQYNQYSQHNQPGTFQGHAGPPQYANNQAGNRPDTQPMPVVMMGKPPLQAGPIANGYSQTASKGRVNRRALLLGVGVAAVTGTGVLAAALILPGLQQAPAKQESKAPVPTSTVPGPHKLIEGVPLLSLTGHSDKVWVATWDQTGQRLASAGDDTWVMVWEIQKALQARKENKQTKIQAINVPQAKWKFTNGFQNNSLDWSFDGKKLLAAPLTEDALYLIDPAKKGTQPQSYKDQARDSDLLPPAYGSVACNPKESLFAATASLQNSILLWQGGKTGGPIGSFPYTPKSLMVPGFQNLAWSNDGKYLAGLTMAGTVAIWETEKRQFLHELVLPGQTNQTEVILRAALQWSPAENDKLLVSTSATATVWNARVSKPLMSLGTDDAEALTPPDPNPSGWSPHTNGMCWSPNGRYIAGCYGRSSKIYVWDTLATDVRAKNGVRMHSLVFGDKGGHTNTLIDVEWSPDGKYLASTSFDKTVIVWQVDGA